MSNDITIGICTYKRPFLINSLRSVVKAIEIANLPINIIVVDNDPNKFAQGIVNEIVSENVKIEYACEPQNGVAYARNKVLELVNSKWLIFLDDDEIVDENWLVEYQNMIEHYEFDAAIGPVITQYPDYVDSVIIQSRILERIRYPHLTEINHGSTGNCLINMNYVNDKDIRFDVKFNMYGEDSDFFEIISKQGKILWNNRSLVYEPLTPERSHQRWIKKRYYTNGFNYARRNIIRGRTIKFVLLSKSFARLAIDSSKLIMNVNSKPIRFRYLCELYRDVGRVKACISIK